MPDQEQLNVTLKPALQMQFLLALPDDYEEKESWPLMLFLHGAGERGTDLDLVKRHGPPKLIDQGKKFPCIVVSPQCPKERWWEAAELSALIDHVVEKYAVDERRIYLTGLSMGGFGTWRLAFYSPERFAAIAPICGGGESYWGKRIAPIPTWAFHGGADVSVPSGRSQMMIDAMEKAGGHPKFTLYPGIGHDSWTATYEDPAFYQWMWQQSRGTRSFGDGTETPQQSE